MPPSETSKNSLAIAIRDKQIRQLKKELKLRDEQLGEAVRQKVLQIFGELPDKEQQRLEKELTGQLLKIYKGQAEEITATVAESKKLTGEIKEVLSKLTQREVVISNLSEIKFPEAFSVKNFPKPASVKFPEAFRVIGTTTVREEEPSEVVMKRNPQGWILLMVETFTSFIATTTFIRDANGRVIRMIREVDANESR